MNWIARFVAVRLSLVWLVLLASAGLLGWLAGEFAHDQRLRERLTQLETDAERGSLTVMSQTLNGGSMGAMALFGLIDDNAKREALDQLPPNSQGAAMLMEDIARAHGADGTFIVGSTGIIKSSWGVGKPLTGVDVKFRPYFQMAMKGKQNVYAAIGTTTGRRNLYFAAPIYAGRGTATPVIGAMVMRQGVVSLDKVVAGQGDLALLLSPQGLVFSATREEWIGRSSVMLNPERIAEIRKLKQFGTLFDKKDPELLPFSLEAGRTTQVEGRSYLVVSAKVQWNDPNGEWTLVLLEDLARSLPMVERLRVSLAVGAGVLLLGWLLVYLLRNHFAQRLASERLAEFGREQQVAAERKAQLAEAGFQMQRAAGRDALMQCYFNAAHRMLGALQGVIYQVDGTVSGQLHRSGDYACAMAPPETLAFGEGLLGQCAIDRRVLQIDTVPDGFAAIRSGLGETAPAALLMAPIQLHQELIGVVELALLRKPAPADLEQFEEMTQLLAMNLEILGRSTNTEQQLAQTLAAEQLHAEQLAFQQALLETIPYPVFYKDAETRFAGVNRAYEDAFGIRRERLVGKRSIDLDVGSEAERMAWQSEDEAVVAGAGQIRREVRLPFVDGQAHDVLYFVSGFRRGDGASGGLVGTYIDISALKTAERERDRLADLERFNRLTQGREQRIIELKREINALAETAGKPVPYATTLVEPVGDHVFEPHPDYRTDFVQDDQLPRLADLVDLDELQSLFSRFCESVGIAAAIIDLEANVLVSSRWQPACTDFHRVHPESCARCIESDRELALKLQDGEDYTMYRCKNGMTDCASPIMVEGHHLANVFIGQFHLGPPDMEFFRQQGRQFNYPEAEYLHAIAEAPVVDEKRLPAILGFLTGFARMISNMSLARRRADLAQKTLEQQAELLRQERVAALSLAEDAAQARSDLAAIAQESEI